MAGLTWRGGRRARAQRSDWDADAWRKQAFADFPHEIVETTGRDALATWERLNAAGRGMPLVIGTEEDVARLSGTLLHNSSSPGPGIAELLATADRLQHPKDLRTYRYLENVSACEFLTDLRQEHPELDFPLRPSGPDWPVRGEDLSEPLAKFLDCVEDTHEPDLGEWPTDMAPSGFLGLTVATDIMTSRPLDRVYIALVPTDDRTALPVHLRWGGWNACPPPEYHTAALRSWRERYGAELVGQNFDTMNLRVARKPDSRDEALALAQEQFDYCEDIVYQGVGTLSNLAAILMVEDWWFFWWD